MERPTTTQVTLKHLWLELTRQCNLRCEHCYASSGPDLPLSERLTVTDWIRIIRSARTAGCETIQFIGGEPLLYPDIDLLLQEASALDFAEVEIFTNATRIKERNLVLIKELNVQVATSFYTVNPIRHEEITHSKGSYLRTVRGIEKLLAASIPVRVGIIRVTQTEEEIRQAISWLQAIGIYQIGIDKMRAVGRADTWLRSKDAFEQLPQLCGACSNGRLCITASGAVFPCVMARAWQIGDAGEEIGSIMQGEKLRAFMSKQREYVERNEDLQCWPNVCKPVSCGPDKKKHGLSGTHGIN